MECHKAVGPNPYQECGGASWAFGGVDSHGVVADSLRCTNFLVLTCVLGWRGCSLLLVAYRLYSLSCYMVMSFLHWAGFRWLWVYFLGGCVQGAYMTVGIALLGRSLSSQTWRWMTLAVASASVSNVPGNSWAIRSPCSIATRSPGRSSRAYLGRPGPFLVPGNLICLTWGRVGFS